jgi:hypothetical protein
MEILKSVPILEDLSETKVEQEVVAKKRRGPGKTWIKGRTFDEPQQSEDFVKNEGNWAKWAVVNTIEGQKTYYRCNKVPKKVRYECRAEIYLLYHSDSFKVNQFVHSDLFTAYFATLLHCLIDTAENLFILNPFH